MVIVLVVFLGIILLFAFIVMGIYNGLITARNYFKNAYAQIDVQLKRRYDLIPNLVETAKGFMKHERETLEAVIQARNQAQMANQKVAINPADQEAVGALGAAETALTGAISKFFALTENYPDLKSDTHMSNLMEELTSTENKVSFARQNFNDSVTSYNNKRETFPSNIIAGMFNFTEARLLEVIDSPEERKSVKVSF